MISGKGKVRDMSSSSDMVLIDILTTKCRDELLLKGMNE